jgi:TldD protein
MDIIADHILNRMRLLGVKYGDMRMVSEQKQLISIQDTEKNLEHVSSEGVGVRVLMDNSWGFGAVSGLSDSSADLALTLAVQNARALKQTEKIINLVQIPCIIDSYETPIKIDPFSVSVSEKLYLLKNASEAMHLDGIISYKASCECERKHQILATTEGAYIDQTLVSTGAGIQCTAAGNGDRQSRSYPNRFGRERSSAGWEYVMEMDLVNHAPVIARQALDLLIAPLCPQKSTTIILDGSQMALTLHETCGHATEFDRMLGQEISLSGGSFLADKKLGKYRLGSNVVSIKADSLTPGGLGTYGYDDEGVPAQEIDIIHDGIFVGYMCNRANANMPFQFSCGFMRSEGWNNISLTRMANFNLEPKQGTLEELIRDTKDGVYMELCRSLSIDTMRLQFQFGSEIAWEIKAGKLTRMLKNPTFHGTTPEFWRNCDAVCGPSEWRMWGTDCGKGQPKQNANVGHGTVPARFHNIQTGVLR